MSAFIEVPVCTKSEPTCKSVKTILTHLVLIPYPYTFNPNIIFVYKYNKGFDYH